MNRPAEFHCVSDTLAPLGVLSVLTARSHTSSTPSPTSLCAHSFSARKKPSSSNKCDLSENEAISSCVYVGPKVFVAGEPSQLL